MRGLCRCLLVHAWQAVFWIHPAVLATFVVLSGSCSEGVSFLFCDYWNTTHIIYAFQVSWNISNLVGCLGSLHSLIWLFHNHGRPEFSNSYDVIFCGQDSQEFVYRWILLLHVLFVHLRVLAVLRFCRRLAVELKDAMIRSFWRQHSWNWTNTGN